MPTPLDRPVEFAEALTHREVMKENARLIHTLNEKCASLDTLEKETNKFVSIVMDLENKNYTLHAENVRLLCLLREADCLMQERGISFEEGGIREKISAYLVFQYNKTLYAPVS